VCGADVTERRGRIRWRFDLQAQDLAEYAILGALIAVVVLVGIIALGGTLTALWNNIAVAFSALP
jgi:Flp pilus assembly pilin Flp